MKTTSSLLILIVLIILCPAAEATEDAPLRWKMQRWEFVVIVQAGDRMTNGQNSYVEKKIVRVLRGKKEDVPEFEFWRNNDLVKDQYYLMHYHKAPPGTSAWEYSKLDNKDGSFIAKAIQDDQDTVFYGTKAVYRDMKLVDFEKLLKETPFETTLTNTFFYKVGMIPDKQLKK